MGRTQTKDSLALGSLKLGMSQPCTESVNWIAHDSEQYMHNKMGGDEAAFATKYVLGNSAGEYASESNG